MELGARHGGTWKPSGSLGAELSFEYLGRLHYGVMIGCYWPLAIDSASSQFLLLRSVGGTESSL